MSDTEKYRAKVMEDADELLRQLAYLREWADAEAARQASRKSKIRPSN